MLEKLKKITWNQVSIVLLVILGIILFFSVKQCQHNKSDANIANLKLTADSNFFQNKIDDLGNKYIEQEQKIVDYDEAVKAGILREADLKAKGLKDASAVINLKQKVSALEDSVLKYKDSNSIITIIDTTTHDTTNYLKLPASVSYSDKWFTLKESILKEGLRIDTLRMYNDQTIIVALRKNGFLRKSTPVITVENKNPYFESIKMSNIIIKQEIPWYQKNSTWFIFGVGTTLTTFILLNKL